MIKTIISILLASTFLFTCALPAFSSSKKTSASIYSVYSDNMLFKQNEEAVIAGNGTPGEIITSELVLNGEIKASGKTSISSNGKFAVTFTAPKGGYEQYTIILKENGTEFKKLQNVVFGELWLVCGQSNMMYPLGQAKGGKEQMENGELLSPWIRVLTTPPYPEYKGSTELLPLEPLDDIKDAKWITAENPEIYGTSAVGYYFADKMLRSLDMPIGILNLNLGGTGIVSWLSREAIDSEEKVKADLINKGAYFSADDWTEDGHNIYLDMTANFNLRINPARNFRLSGMLWYQGESDINITADEYERAFDLLQKSYTELFNYDNGLLPVIYSQLASYFYDTEGLLVADRNIDFINMQKRKPDSRAVISIYDLPLTFLPETGLIHPEHKREIGERMAFAAEGLVYGKSNDYSTPAVTDYEIKENSIYVSFSNTGDGLKINGSYAEGFALAGDDGIFLRADAEIINKNTIRIYSDEVDNPISATYAYCVNNTNSNLYATQNGSLSFPVSQFKINADNIKQKWISRPWADFESDTVWHTHNDAVSKYYPLWEAEGANIAFTENDAFSGDKGMNLKSETAKFSISPLLTFKDGIKNSVFYDVDPDYSNYGTISLNIKNNGKNDVKLNEIRFITGSAVWYSPEFENSLDTSAVIPADGNWHNLTFNLNRLYLHGNECGISFTKNKISEVKDIVFKFSSDESSDISVDHIRFTPDIEDSTAGFEINFENADNFFETLSAIAVTVIGAIASLLT